MSTNITLADQLLAHRKKRQALEQLISFARQISVAGDSMEALQFAARPSQRPDKGKLSFLLEMTAHLQAVDTATLQTRLAQIDKLLIAEVELFLHIATLNEDDFMELPHQNPTEDFHEQIESVQKRLQSFKRKAQTNVALRLVLHERGVQLQALKLPIAQDALAQQVTVLRQKENFCRKKIIQDIRLLLADTAHILHNHQYPQQMVDKLWETHDNLQQALAHLESGKSIESLSFNIEAHLEIDALPIAPDALPLPAVEETPTEASKQLQEAGKNGFFARIDRWLNTPFDVSWNETKRDDRKH